MGKMLIFHGGGAEIPKPEILVGKNTKDFGTGFYCTVIREQAERWSKRFARPRINAYSFLTNESLDVLEFKTMTEAWLDFIIDCRAGKPHNHDIVIGAMADDQIYNFISDYMEGIITREQFWSLAKFKYPTHQICFCTAQALKCLHFEYSEEVK